MALSWGEGVEVEFEFEVGVEVEVEFEGPRVLWEWKTASRLAPQPASGDVTVAPPREVPPTMFAIFTGT